GLALLERLVVARVGPREDFRLHAVAVHLLVPLDDLGGLLRVDLDGPAVLVDLHGAVAPHDGRAGRDRVEVLADRNTDRVPHLLQLEANLVEVFPGLGRGDVVDADLDAGVLRETRPDLGELLVRERREVVPAEVRDLTLLPTRGRYAGGEDSREARPGRGRQELSSGQ